MHNLITEPLAVVAIVEVLREARTQSLMPPLGSPEWREVAARPALRPWIAALHAQGEAERGLPLPELTDALYARFQSDGSRLPFERPYFERRQRLARAVLCALLFPDDPIWQPEVSRIVQIILDEISWALPAHIDVVSGKDPGRIDLFGSETAEMLGAVAVLLGEFLPAPLRSAIRSRIRVQIIDNFLTNYARRDYPGAFWTHSPANWNAVCHQGVVGAALWLEDDPAILARVLHQAAEGLADFTAGFGADGGSSEGPAYWGYGFGRFAWLNQQVETGTAGHLSLVEGDPHIPEIAKFARRMSVEGGQWINFADCAPSGLPDPALSAYLGERLHDTASQRQAEVSYVAQLAEPPSGRLFEMLRFPLYCPAEIDLSVRPTAEDSFFADLQVLVAHGQDAAGNRGVFAAKGGHNDEHHNHNDCGSFVYYMNGVCFAEEIGAPEYVKAFFGPDRYREFLAARSLGHSVPLINGVEQGAGSRFAARVLSHALTPDKAELVLDLTACYPAEAGCIEARRRLTFDRSTLSLEVEDGFTLAEWRSVEAALISDADVALQPDESALLILAGQRLRVIPGADCKMSEVQTHSYSRHDGTSASVRRLVLTTAALAPKVALRYTLKPA